MDPSNILSPITVQNLKIKFGKNLCSNYNVKLIHGLPYLPHSQGVVERVHRVIKKGLLCHKENLKEKYNINYSLEEVISIKNDTICRTTKKSPNDLFFNDNIDENEKKKINNLMINSQKYSNVYRNSYKKGENIRVNNNLKFSNKKLKK